MRGEGFSYQNNGLCGGLGGRRLIALSHKRARATAHAHVQINLTGFLERNTGAFSKMPTAPEHSPAIFERLMFCLTPQRGRQARFGQALRPLWPGVELR